MKVAWQTIAAATRALMDVDNVHHVTDDTGLPCLAYSGKGLEATLLLSILYKGIRDGEIEIDIPDDWRKITYWKKLVCALEREDKG